MKFIPIKDIKEIIAFARLKKNIFKVIIACLIVFCIIAISYARTLDIYENILLDLRFRLRPLQAYSDEIVIIEVSDDTLEELGYWPLPRDFHASLIDVLSYVGAKQIIFDIIFTDATDQDVVFEESIRKAKNVYLSYVVNIKNQKLSKGFPHAQGLITPILPSLESAAKGVGYINSYIDADGKTRWAPLFVKDNQILHTQLALKSACDYLGIPLKNVVFKNSTVSIDGKLRIPTSPNGAVLINFSGPWRNTFRHYSYVDVLAAFQENIKGKKTRIDLNSLKGAVCFVGLTATGTSDLNPVPIEKNYPMVGLHANLFNSFINNQFVVRASKSVNIIILLFLLGLVLITSFYFKKKPFMAFLVTVLYGSLFFLTSVCFFIFFNFWIDIFYPLVMMFITYLGITIYHFVGESRRRELMERELSIAKKIQESFLPKPIESFHTLKIASYMSPAKQVGGDLYDMRVLGQDKFGVLIGDVSGKGVGAALVMAKTITVFRMVVDKTEKPSDLLFQLNEELAKDLKPGMFVTATYIIYDAKKRRVTVASAGHSPTLVFREKDSIIEKVIPKEGLPLGLMTEVEYSQEVIDLQGGDNIVLYTDGVTEARNTKEEEFDEERLDSTLMSAGCQGPKEVLSAICQAVKNFSGKRPPHDDCTIIVLGETKNNTKIS
jgi:CHASE2 domain-containing sensor protein